MFTIQQIKEAHSKVKSGADFPKYMQDISVLGVVSFETYVCDNHTNYFGVDHFKITSERLVEILVVNNKCNADQFQLDLKSHQEGRTDYKTFMKDCANSSVDKWIVVMDTMTCTYYDKAGNEMLVEVIPSV